MCIKMGCKINIGKQYEMSEFSVELSDSEFPELKGKTEAQKLQYLQGVALFQILLFKVSVGYTKLDSPEYNGQMSIVSSLKNI